MSPDDRNGLVVEHRDLARAIAESFVLPPSFELQDLVQAGMLGLIDAVERFDPAKGVPFAAYARFRIRGAILDSVRRKQYLESTQEELPDQVAAGVESIDVAIDRQRAAERLLAAISRLPPRERQLVELRYRGETPFVAIGAALQVSKTRVTQLHARAIKHLRALLIAA